jgi:hypothetical protein
MPVDYRIAKTAAGQLSWKRATEHLRRARNYWVSSTRPDGRPHAMPLWGVWLDGAFYFGTDRRSRKARNLAANPALVVHLESGDDTVILEGRAELVSDATLLSRIDGAYLAKYRLRLLGHPGELGVYRLRPQLAFAWREKDFNRSATRWRFDPER